MSPKLWSDEDRLFIPRMGGWTINFKFIARKLRWAKASASQPYLEQADVPEPLPETAEERQRRSIARSRFEDH